MTGADACPVHACLKQALVTVEEVPWAPSWLGRSVELLGLPIYFGHLLNSET